MVTTTGPSAARHFSGHVEAKQRHQQSFMATNYCTYENNIKKIDHKYLLFEQSSIAGRCEVDLDLMASIIGRSNDRRLTYFAGASNYE